MSAGYGFVTVETSGSPKIRVYDGADEQLGIGDARRRYEQGAAAAAGGCAIGESRK